jgi:hypothetical protein
MVGSFLFRDRFGKLLRPPRLHGRIWIIAAAYDQAWPAVPAPWRGFPIAPALLAWRMTTSTGLTVIPERIAVDFRRRLPPESAFWRTYARGSYQNFPVVGLHYYFQTPGAYLYKLVPSGFDTRRLRAGSYRITVTATDMGGNQDSRSELIRIRSAPPPCRGCRDTTIPTSRTPSRVV